MWNKALSEQYDKLNKIQVERPTKWIHCSTENALWGGVGVDCAQDKTMRSGCVDLFLSSLFMDILKMERGHWAAIQKKPKKKQKAWSLQYRRSKYWIHLGLCMGTPLWPVLGITSTKLISANSLYLLTLHWCSLSIC